MKRTTRILTTIFTLLTFLTFNACIDEENDLISQDCKGSCATINGLLTTNDGMQPLIGVEVIAKWVNTVYLGGGTIRTKAKTRTDNLGNYTLKFEVRSDELEEGYFQFEVLTGKEYFRCNDKEHPSFSYFELRNDTSITQNLFIPYVAHLNVGSIGAENMSGSDYFSVTISPDIRINSNACGSVMGWKNQDPNWVYKIDVPGKINLVVETVINKGQSYERSYDTLMIDKGQTETFTAVYK